MLCWFPSSSSCSRHWGINSGKLPRGDCSHQTFILIGIKMLMRKGGTSQFIKTVAADRRRNNPRRCGVTTAMRMSASPPTQVNCKHTREHGAPLGPPSKTVGGAKGAPPTVDTSKQTFQPAVRGPSVVRADIGSGPRTERVVSALGNFNIIDTNV